MFRHLAGLAFLAISIAFVVPARAVTDPPVSLKPGDFIADLNPDTAQPKAIFSDPGFTLLDQVTAPMPLTFVEPLSGESFASDGAFTCSVLRAKADGTLAFAYETTGAESEFVSLLVASLGQFQTTVDLTAGDGFSELLRLADGSGIQCSQGELASDVRLVVFTDAKHFDRHGSATFKTMGEFLLSNDEDTGFFVAEASVGDLFQPAAVPLPAALYTAGSALAAMILYRGWREIRKARV